jgi:hypothetical protein
MRTGLPAHGRHIVCAFKWSVMKRVGGEQIRVRSVNSSQITNEQYTLFFELNINCVKKKICKVLWMHQTK